MVESSRQEFQDCHIQKNASKRVSIEIIESCGNPPSLPRTLLQGVHSVSYSSPYRCLISAGFDHEAHIWWVHECREVGINTGGNKIECCALEYLIPSTEKSCKHY